MLPDPVSLLADGVMFQGIDSVVSTSQQDIMFFEEPLVLKSKQFTEQGDDAGSALYYLLAVICTFGVNLEKPNMPFGPRLVMDTMRTLSIEDMAEGHFKMLATAIPHVANVELRARMADVLWNQKKRSYKHALIAVEAYLTAAKDLDDPSAWSRPMFRLRRAFQIAKMLGPSSEAYPPVEAYILERARSLGSDSPLFFLAHLFELLLEGHRDQTQCDEFGHQAEATANHAIALSDPSRAQTYLLLAERWFTKGGNESKAAAVKLAAAEAYVTEAHLQSSDLVQATLLRRAVNALRNAHASPETLGAVRSELDLAQRRAVLDMKTLEVSTDISDMVTTAREAAKGKTLTECFRLLALSAHPPTMDRLRTQTTDLMQKAPFSSLFSRTRVDQNGRVVGLTGGALSSEGVDRENAILAEMHELGKQQQDLTVTGWVNPFRRQMLSEHTIELTDIIREIRDRPFIPEGRTILFAMGLLAGFNGDFIASASILLPQLEHALRTLLEGTGEIVYSQDAIGLQNLYDLSKTLEHENLKKVLGPDYLFDLRGLLVSRAGTNFRNELSHGLLTLTGLQGSTSAYLWWLTLNLIFRLRLMEPDDKEPSSDK